MKKTVAIGKQDFSEMIEGGYFYIDKTAFIKEWWENGDDVTLITRPRRFGKTLTMRMTEQFFSIAYKERASLFSGLKIWEEASYRKLQGTYPVLFLSFAGIKEDSCEKAKQRICQVFVNLYADHRFLAEGSLLTDAEKDFFKSVSVTMDDVTATLALHQLSRYLSRYYGKKVLILLDEYDTPMQEAYVHGYWEELVSFTRSLFNNTFKTNPYLYRAIMTGITRISRESVFSDLNNLMVVTTTSKMYEDCFGFTEPEVFQALEEFGLQGKRSEVKRWYDGFCFGDCENIYNPWSITNYLKSGELRPYWANTSSNQLVGRLMQASGITTKYVMEDLLKGSSFSTQLDEEVVFAQLDDDIQAVWSLLLASGYLRIEGFQKNRFGQTEYVLRLTNLEVRTFFDRMVKSWFSLKELKYHDFSEALLCGNMDFMNEYINTVSYETFSFFDTGQKSSTYQKPENFYHGFVLGLIADLRELYFITSNRESGRGRYDVMLEPHDPQADDAIILEFKVHDLAKEHTLQDSVQEALAQIVNQKYAAALEARGMDRERIRIYGFAFRGKYVLIDGGYLADLKKRSGFSCK